MKRINLALSTLIILSVLGCKTPNTDSKVSSVMVASDGGYQVIYPTFFKGTAIDSEQAGEAKGPIKNFCLQTCVSDPAVQSAFGIRCEVKGHVPSEKLLEAGATMSPAAQLLIADAISNGMQNSSADSPDAEAGLREVTSQFQITEQSERICKPVVEGEGLSLQASFFHTNVYFNNKSSYPVQLSVAGLILTTSGLFEARGGAVFNIGANQRGILTVDGGTVFGGLAYRITYRDKEIKSLSTPVLFTKPQPGGIYEFSVSNYDFPSNTNTGNRDTSGNSGRNDTTTNRPTGNSGRTPTVNTPPALSSSVKECIAKLKKVKDLYPTGDAQFSSNRDTEIKNCWNAVDQSGASWSKLMKVYYCEHPGQPIRACFTPTVQQFRQKGYDQKGAYSSGFLVCKNSGKFDTMDTEMIENFKAIMLNGWKSSDDDQCVKEFGRNP